MKPKDGDINPTQRMSLSDLAFLLTIIKGKIRAGEAESWIQSARRNSESPLEALKRGGKITSDDISQFMGLASQIINLPGKGGTAEALRILDTAMSHLEPGEKDMQVGRGPFGDAPRIATRKRWTTGGMNLDQLWDDNLDLEDRDRVTPPPSMRRASAPEMRPAFVITHEAAGRYVYPHWAPRDEAGNQAPVELGRGGLGRVLVVHDLHMRRDVALKEILDEDLPRGSPEYRAAEYRFLREARVTAQLEHPNIIPVYEIGQRSNGRLYYTMQYIKGDTLSSSIEKAHGLKERLRLLSRFELVCSAMAYAHSRGVLHRDLKPENVMLGPFGETFVLDWGLARVRGITDTSGHSIVVRQLIVDSNPSQTLPGGAFGTPAYMSPEQAAGRMKDLTPESDVWSLGVILFEILTGVRPFNAADNLMLMRAIVMDPVPSVRVMESAVPEALAAICEKALQKDPANRYRDAGELAADIRHYLNGEQIPIYHVSLTRRFRHVAKQRWKEFLLALALTMTLVALTWGLFSSSGGPVGGMSVAQPSRAVLDIQSSLFLRGEREAQNNSWSNAAAYVAAAQDKLDTPLLTEVFNNYAAKATRVQARLETPFPGPFSAMEFTGGDLFLTVVSSGGGIARWSVRDWKAQPVLHTGAAMLRAVVDPVSGMLLGSNDSGGIQAADTASGRSLASWKAHPSQVMQLAWSPSAKLLATAGADHMVRLWRSPDWKLEREFASQGVPSAMAFSPDGKMLAMSFQDEALQVLDLKSGNQYAVNTVMDGGNAANLIMFSHDGLQLLASTPNIALRSWDLAGKIRTHVEPLRRMGNILYSMSYIPGGSLIFLGSEHLGAIVWDSRNFNLVEVAGSSHAPVRWTACGKTRSICATMNPEGKVQVLEIGNRWRGEDFKGKSPRHILRMWLDHYGLALNGTELESVAGAPPPSSP
ncbi:MAG: Serine/threonine-protein kinase PknD [Myxococcota bacterium]|nr:Serine/threonine-protein kinase PknD [Myxococcota bacterium]